MIHKLILPSEAVHVKRNGSKHKLNLIELITEPNIDKIFSVKNPNFSCFFLKFFFTFCSLSCQRIRISLNIFEETRWAEVVVCGKSNFEKRLSETSPMLFQAKAIPSLKEEKLANKCGNSVETLIIFWLVFTQWF